MRIFVTDIIEYLICPTKLYLRKIKGISKENEIMLKGTIIHRVFELISEREKQLWESMEELDYNNFKQKYLFIMGQSIAKAILENKEKLDEFHLDERELIKEIYPTIKREVEFRINYIWDFVEKYGYEFYKHINPEIESEVLLEYNDLVGRIDRLEKYKSGRLVPVEIKTSKRFKELHAIQLGGYAYLLEKNFGIEVNDGILFYPRLNRRVHIELNPYKEIFLETYEKVKEFLESPKFIRPRNGFCQICEYKSQCPLYKNKLLKEYLI